MEDREELVETSTKCSGVKFGSAEQEKEQGRSTSLVKYTNTESSKLLLSLGRLHAACWGVVEEWGHTTSSSGPDHVVSLFQEQLPSSLHARWLEERHDLKKLVLQAYKYAFKFVYDMRLPSSPCPSFPSLLYLPPPLPHASS